MTTKKSIPKFENEDQERAYWAKHSPLDHFDLATAGRAKFPNLKPSLKSISIRLPESMLDEGRPRPRRRRLHKIASRVASARS